MKNYKCTYEYSGMETEGRIETQPTQFIEAESKAEAMYKYLQYIDEVVNQGRYGSIVDKHTLDSWKKLDYCEGGWGFNVVEV